jgi:hypothetical protein
VVVAWWEREELRREAEARRLDVKAARIIGRWPILLISDVTVFWTTRINCSEPKPLALNSEPAPADERPLSVNKARAVSGGMR